MDHSKILGTVLAGGKSQRFGEDKSQVKLGDKLNSVRTIEDSWKKSI